MSMSDIDFSSHGSEYKNFRQISRDRLLHEMLGSTKTEDSKSAWKVLIMDKVTTKVMSSSCKMADITDQGVSLVEDLYRRRQPLPSMDSIYFIQPSKEKTAPAGLYPLVHFNLTEPSGQNGFVSSPKHWRARLCQNRKRRCISNVRVVMFLSDMSGRVPLYKKAYVFFSSPIPKDLVNRIKNDTSVLPRIGALREMNLEYFPVDSQAFITDHERALEELLGQKAENTRKFDNCLNIMATRISTIFASLKELPFVRYRAAKNLDGSAGTAFNDSVPTKLAAAVWDQLDKYRSTIPNFPQTGTCELLILDRSIDQIAPVIHEWTYDAMCHDLLDMDGNKYVHEIPSKTGGEPEKKEVLLEDHDPVWLELRHAHIADASERLHDKMTNFVSKNKAAQLHQKKDSGELSTRDLQKMVQALPQYSEQMEKLSLHVEIAGKINRIIREMGLRDLGQLEQDLVFGDAGAKEVINFLRTKQDAPTENKLRLLMIYASVYPEKFEGDKGLKLMQLAKLSPDDMKVVNNMRMLEGSSASKKMSSGGFSLKFDAHKTKNAARKDRNTEEETWQLSRFYPMIEDLIEKLNKGELPKNEYLCKNEPSQPAARSNDGASARVSQSSAAQPAKSRRTATWARSRVSDDGSSSDSVLRNGSMDFKNMGQRIFVFIIGGATRSELRVCHKLTTKLRREVILGTSSMDDPPQFITMDLSSFQEKELLAALRIIQTVPRRLRCA